MALSALLAAVILKVMIAPRPAPESALINVGIHQAYSDLDTVKRAVAATAVEQTPPLLADASMPIGDRLATASAVAQRFVFTPYVHQYVQTAYKTSLEKLKLESLRGDELLVLGVLVGGSM